MIGKRSALKASPTDGEKTAQAILADKQIEMQSVPGWKHSTTAKAERNQAPSAEFAAWRGPAV
jgi:hypothetical protein